MLAFNDYELPEWVEDFRWGVVNLRGDPEGNQERIVAYFRLKYPPPTDYEDRMVRFISAFNFLGAHIDELDTGHALVKGREHLLVSAYLLVAFWRVFAFLPHDSLSEPGDPGLFVSLAEELYQANREKLEAAVA